MQRLKTIWKGETLVRRHVSMTESLYEHFQNEADASYGGNLSLLFRLILEDRYKTKKGGYNKKAASP